MTPKNQLTPNLLALKIVSTLIHQHSAFGYRPFIYF